MTLKSPLFHRQCIDSADKLTHTDRVMQRIRQSTDSELGQDKFKIEEESTMKKVTLVAFILALVLGASASTVNFGALPAKTTPSLLPNGYGNLDWSNFYYVDPIWSGAGDGFKRGPNSLDVAFMGGGQCEKEGVSCSASISSNSSSSTLVQGFTAQSAIVAAGFHSELINVSAYNQRQLCGIGAVQPVHFAAANQLPR